jgi:uncharacterized protein YecT (DUF1311 family)
MALLLGTQLLFTSASAQPQVGQTGWLLAYAGKSTNQLIWDKRAKPLVNSRVPASLSENVLLSLGGPPDPVLAADGRYVSMSACRAHSCIEKGFMWVDTMTGMGLGAYYLSGKLQLGSNSLSAGNIPPQARAALINWLAEQDLITESAEFVDRTGKAQALEVASFSAPARFRPPATGPSFDCARAASGIEKAICADTALSAQDLELSNLYREIRHGSSTGDAQQQLLDLQRAWLRQRDRECAQGDIAGCLKQQYVAQKHSLSNWTPAPQPSAKP